MRRKYAIHPGQGQLDFGWPPKDDEVVQRLGLPVICGDLLWPLARQRSLQCQWETQYGTQCSWNGSDGMLGIRLCTQHEKSADGHLRRYLHGQPHIITELYWEIFGESRFGGLPAPGRSVVYFVERQGFVKIGTTTNLEQRLRSIGKGGQMIEGMTVGPVRLIATMPGDQRHEKLLHRQFSDLSAGGEWFLPDTRLCDFIGRLSNVNRDLLSEVRIRHGLADPGEIDDSDEEAS
jgi:hypothetical protein